MKKMSIFLIILAFAFLLISCKESTSTSPTTTTAVTTTSTTTTPTTSTTTTVTYPVVIRETGVGYDTIGEAITAATAGQHIDVSEGTYKEKITLDKQLYLTGENRITTVIDGEGSGNIVTVNSGADGSILIGFHIRNGACGIYSSSAPTITLERNIIRDNVTGVDLIVTSGSLNIYGILIENHTATGLHLHLGGISDIVSESIFQNNYDGFLCSSSPSIIKCQIKNNTRYGLGCSGSAQPDVGGGTGGSIGQNVIQGNGVWDFYNLTSNAIKAENNRWDHITAAEIDAQDIYDDDEDPTRGAVDFDPFLTGSSFASLRLKPRLLSASSLFADFFRSLFRSDLPASAIYIPSSFEPKLHIARFDLLEARYRPFNDEVYYPPLRLRAKR
jgi:hypothetical protein